MTWMAIITALLTAFGPLLADLLKQWLDDLFQRAAARLPSPTAYASGPGLRLALVSEAIRVHDDDGRALWWFQRLPWSRHARRRRLLERMRDLAQQDGLTAANEDELRSLAAAAV